MFSIIERSVVLPLFHADVIQHACQMHTNMNCSKKQAVQNCYQLKFLVNFKRHLRALLHITL